MNLVIAHDMAARPRKVLSASESYRPNPLCRMIWRYLMLFLQSSPLRQISQLPRMLMPVHPDIRRPCPPSAHRHVLRTRLLRLFFLLPNSRNSHSLVGSGVFWIHFQRFGVIFYCLVIFLLHLQCRGKIVVYIRCCLIALIISLKQAIASLSIPFFR